MIFINWGKQDLVSLSNSKSKTDVRSRIEEQMEEKTELHVWVAHQNTPVPLSPRPSLEHSVYEIPWLMTNAFFFFFNESGSSEGEFGFLSVMH